MITLLLPLFTGMALALSAQIPCNGEFLLSGNAVPQGDCIALTENSVFQQGCAWLNTPVDFSQPFTHDMQANFGTVDGSGADGICLIYQTAGSNICGGSGSGMGAQGIPNSFIIEFDTWDNGGLQSDIPEDHTAIAINGDLNNQLNGPIALPNIEDGTNHTITFSWMPGSNQYSVAFDGTVVMSGVFDIVTQCFQGNPLAYWGYTASTGSAFNRHTVCPILPPEIPVDAGPDQTVFCLDAQVTLDGSNTAAGAFTYSWSSPTGGQILSGSNTLTPTVQGPGNYVLTLFNPDGGCEETDTVAVNYTPLAANINAPGVAPCSGGQVTLSGAGSSQGSHISYLWETPDGALLTDPTAVSVQAGAPGTYRLWVTYDDGQTSCMAQASVDLQPYSPPPPSTLPGGNLNCNQPVLTITGLDAFAGPAYTYQWETTEGTILSGAQTLEPQVSTAGAYTLNLLNTTTNCASTIIVNVGSDIDPPAATATASGPLGCHTEQVTLSGLGSAAGPNISYSWQTQEGYILSGANSLIATVDEPGDYTLLVTNQENGCFNFAEVTVEQGALSPTLSIAEPDTLNCGLNSTPLLSTVVPASAHYSYQWSTTNGSLLGGVSQPDVEAGAPGLYRLTVRDTLTGCLAADSVAVMQQISTPVAAAGPDRLLDCGMTQVSLDGTATTPAASQVTQWSTPDGQLITEGEALAPIATAPGLYVLTVTDTITHCTASDTVAVTSNINLPATGITAPDTLDCNTGTVNLESNLQPSGQTYTLKWKSPDGHSIANATSPVASVSQPGWYFLEVSNPEGTCTLLDSTWVERDTAAPLAAIAPPNVLTCKDTLALLDGSASTGAPNLAFQWAHLNDGFIDTANEPTYTAQSAGTYTLLVSNLDNGCTAADTVTVNQNTVKPTVAISPPDTLTCTRPSITIDGSGSSQSSSLQFLWQSDSGGLAAGTSTPTPQVTAPGTYTLTITDLSNGCVSFDSVQVMQDTLAPAVAILPPPTLNCRDTVVSIQANVAAGQPVLEWSTADGHLADGQSSAAPTVDAPGSYILQVTDIKNGCTATATAAVAQDTTAPTAAIAPAGSLTCDQPQQQLDGTPSDLPAEWAAEWQGPAGQLPANSLQTLTSQPGLYTLRITNQRNFCSDTASIQLQQNATPPSLQMLAPDTLNCTVSTVALSAAVDTNLSLAYQWAALEGELLTAPNAPVAQTSQAGTYQLTVENEANGCQRTKTITVQQDTVAPMVAALSPTLLTCTQPAAWLDAAAAPSANWAYEWAVDATGSAILSDSSALLVSAAGTYEVTVTDPGNACTAFATYPVAIDTLPPEATIPEPAVLNCQVDTVMLSSSGYDPEAPLTFSWATQNGLLLGSTDGPQAAATAPGLYTLTVSDSENGCANTYSVSVSQDTVAPLAAIAPPDAIDCQRPSVQLSAAGSSTGLTFAYTWSTPSGAFLSGLDGLQPTVSAAGQYTLQVADTTNHCVATATAIVVADTTAPAVAIAPAEKLNCDRPTVTLGAVVSMAAEAFAIRWEGPPEGLLSGAESLSPTVGEPGQYVLQVTNLENGCEAAQAVTVEQDTAAPVASAGADFTMPCFPEPQWLDGTGSSEGPHIAYQWLTDDGVIAMGGRTRAPAIDAPGTYTLLVRNLENGCSSRDSVAVSQDQPQALATALAPACHGETGQIRFDTIIGGSAPFVYSIDGGASYWGTDRFDGLPPGQYALAVQDINGCEDHLELRIEQPDALALQLPGEEVTLQFGESLDLNLQSNYPLQNLAEIAWSGQPGLSCYDCLAPTATPSITTAYTVRASNDRGCQAQARIRVVVDRTAPVYIPDAFSPNGDGRNDYFTVFARPEAVRQVRSMAIYDRWGNVLFSQKDFAPNTPEAGWDGNARDTPANTGLFAYVVEIEYTDGRTELYKGDFQLLR